MKRAAFVIIAIAALMLLGSPSVPVPDGSSCYASATNTSAGSGAILTGGGQTGEGSSGSGNGSGGADQGDADGVSGLKLAPGGRVPPKDSYSVTINRVAVLVEMWWKLMISIR